MTKLNICPFQEKVINICNSTMKYKIHYYNKSNLLCDYLSLCTHSWTMVYTDFSWAFFYKWKKCHVNNIMTPSGILKELYHEIQQNSKLEAAIKLSET